MLNRSVEFEDMLYFLPAYFENLGVGNTRTSDINLKDHQGELAKLANPIRCNNNIIMLYNKQEKLEQDPRLLSSTKE